MKFVKNTRIFRSKQKHFNGKKRATKEKCILKKTPNQFNHLFPYPNICLFTKAKYWLVMLRILFAVHGQKISISSAYFVCMFIHFFFDQIFIFSVVIFVSGAPFTSCYFLFHLIFVSLSNICSSFCLFFSHIVVVWIRLFLFFFFILLLDLGGPLCANQPIYVPHANIKTITITYFCFFISTIVHSNH